MRYTILFLAAALLALAALAQGHAQEPPVQLSPVQLPGSGTGSISGRIVFQLHPFPSATFRLYVVPAETPQPFNASLAGGFSVNTDRQGNFIRDGLKEGDYYVIQGRSLVELAVTLPDSVRWVTAGVEITRPALRVTLADGQALSGIEIVIRSIVPIPIIDDFRQPLSPPAAIAPATGAGPGGADDTVGRIVAGLAMAAALLLAGGVALWGLGSHTR